MKINQLPLPKNILSILLNQGIDTFYPPQEKAMEHVLKKENLVLAIPTASGKSLVAYIAMFNQLISRGGKALYVVPLIALAREKYEDLSIFEEAGFKIGISTGDLDDSDPRLARYDIIICTSEKADSLLRHGVSWVHEVSSLIIDEIHLIQDPTRGPTLEVLIARFRSLNPETQIIGLSATIQNALDLSIWLDAKLVQSDWRPVPLKEGVLHGRILTYDTGEEITIEKNEATPMAELVSQSLSKKGQVLVFVNTRRSTASVAHRLGITTKKFLLKDEQQRIQDELNDFIKKHAERTSIDKTLLSCIKNGIAFHHAGLASYQRRFVERSFKDGLIKCIVATPTLAAGVNIPAKRVIIRDLWRYEANMGMQPIPVLEYKQQAGRAGRPKYDSEGEAITIAKKKSQKDMILSRYIHGETEPIYSKLGNQASLRMHLLAAIATGFVHTEKDILQFIDSTFYAYQAEAYTLQDEIDDTIDFLLRYEFITETSRGFEPTIFGMKTSSLYIDPLSAVELKKSLTAGYEANKLPTDLAVLQTVCSTPDVRSLYLRKSDSWVEMMLEGCKDDLFCTVPPSVDEDFEWFLSDFKTALLLRDWIEERTEDDMIAKYGVGPGDIHGIVQTVHWLLHAMREFSRMYYFDAVSFLTGLGLRVEYGCKKELLTLVELKGIGRVRARKLYHKGYKSLDSLRKATVEELSSIPTIGPGIAARIKEQLGQSQNYHESQLTEFLEEDDDRL
jgi:helicase